MNGTIFNIQKFCINDGPGIRTTVFLKGCPLNCAWCHNPESKKTVPEIMFNESKCIMCGKCVEVCPAGCHSFSEESGHTYNRESCIACGKCSEVCVCEALETVGKQSAAEEVIKEVLKDKAFYDNSGGGLTVSGGEPMLQFDFTYELLTAAKKEGLHTCIETCGFASAEKYKKIAEVVDIFLFDWKVTDCELHKKYTGVSNEIILNNLKLLNSLGANIILRCPIIPTVNDTEEHFKMIAALAEELENVSEVNIEPYHPLGTGKIEKLGGNDVLGDIKMPENETVEQWIKENQSMTKVTVKKHRLVYSLDLWIRAFSPDYRVKTHFYA